MTGSFRWWRAAALVAFLIVHHGMAATYHVDSVAGNDLNSGTTPDKPWKSLSRVADFEHSPGDEFLLKRGSTWHGTLRLSQPGWRGRPITLGAYGEGPRPVIDAGGRPVALDLMNVRYVNVRGLRVTNSSLVGIRVVAEKGRNCGNIEITDTESDHGVTGIQIVGLTPALPVHDVLVADSLVHHNLYDGVLVNCFVKRVTLRANKVYENARDVDLEGNWPTAGIRLISMYDNPADPAKMREYVQDVLIEQNEVYRNGHTKQSRAFMGWGIHADTVKNCIVRRNRVYANGCVGLMLEDSEDCEVSYNLVYNHTADPEWSVGLAVYRENERNRVFNNTIYNSLIGLSVGTGSKRPDSVVGNWIANNISVGNSNANLLAADGGENSGNGNGNVYTNNCFGRGGRGLIRWGFDNRLASYDEWDRAYGRPAKSVRADPLFIEPAEANFALRPDSRCIDAGVDAGADADLAGLFVPLGDAPDIGAFEFRAQDDQGGEN